MKTRLLLLSLLLPGLSLTVSSQYFGQNKPRYTNFDFRVLNTPRYQIYYYTDNDPFITEIAKQAEQWYDLHNAIIRDTLVTKNPLLFYNNHADFQQTSAVYGAIGTGTGGVTEGLRNRVILPFTFTNQQTHHVLGHELVHAFQYNMIIYGDSTSIRNMANLPLWMVEGLAEYMSIGRYDAHTAMWMRDAVLNDDIPTFKDMRNPKYFPYRWGQAFWAFVSGAYGDQVIEPLFEMTAKYGFEIASDSIFHTSAENVFTSFREALKTYYTPMLSDGKERGVGKKIISEENAGEMNISPAMSPNGRWVIFLSEKNLFSIDLFLADARTGKIVKRITSLTRDGHLDDLSFLETSGTWSPDSKQFAFIAFEKGQNVIVIKDVDTGKSERTIRVPGVPAISNPAWAPDGKTIVFSGLVEGQTDLYSIDLKSNKVTQLTNDRYSEIQPNFNAEGTHLAYATDKLSMDNGRTHGKWTMNLAVLNLATGKAGQIDLFQGADNLNPSFDHEGNLYFLSDRDGFRNIYKYNVATGEVLQMTEFLTGVSGITTYSPALSVATSRDRIVYSHFYRGNYTIYQADKEDMLNKTVSKNEIDVAAATLPVVGLQTQQVIQTNLDNLDRLPEADTTSFTDARYKPRFKLDYIGGSTGIGVSSGTFGARTGLAGGIEMLFSDVLGNNQLYTVLALNGDILDFGGAVTYLNTKRRLQWGASLSHIPYRTGYVDYSFDTIPVNGGLLPVLREDINVLRIFEDQASLLIHLPFSKATRWEASAGISYQFYRQDQYPNFYVEDDFGYRFYTQGSRERVPIEEDAIILGGFVVKKGAYYNINTAYVGDKSSFGVTAPLNGYRYRLEVSRNLGSYDFWSNTADGRVYQYLKPVSLAFRLTHHARYGTDANSFNPILLGYQGLVHGYDYNQIFKRVGLSAGNPDNNATFNEKLTEELYRLSGSKIAVTGMEVRLPFSGPERLSLIKSGFFYSDLSWFFDVGVAFDDFSHFKDGEPIVIQRFQPDGSVQLETIYRKPKIAMSTGLGLRLNLFGAMIIEPYVAYPLEKDSKLLLGIYFVPGW
ncbi:MAG TPA: hypothetical protein VI603_04555 [Saprospiraceae bacterium]|nr:hypothetical protein [Saprospiraceae bacterium]